MWIQYEHVSFNSEWAASKSLKDFQAHESHHGLSKEQLKEAYELCKAQSKEIAPAGSDAGAEA